MRVTFIFKNEETGDDLYSFKFTANFTYQQYSDLKEYNLYYDTEPNQLHRF